MASEEILMINSSSIQDEDYEDNNTEDGFHNYYQTRQNSLSRLSICTSSFHDDEDDDDVTNHNHPSSELSNFISDLSLDDDVGAEADGEFSDESDNSDKESCGFYSLPATIVSRRRRQENNDGGSKCNLVKQRRVIREKSNKRGNQYGHGFNGSDGGDGNSNVGGGGGELRVLTEVNGGKKKSMRMGFEEVKACRDLGFDLEIPGRVSVSAGSNRETQTSSGGNSPIANWRISSPGDDPREVKARLKMWAQAVALASASR